VSTDGRRRSDVVEEIVEHLWEWFDAHPDHPASARHDDGPDEDEGGET
jgi:hypothetical protein